MNRKKVIVLAIILSIGLVPTLILTFLPFTALEASANGSSRELGTFSGMVINCRVELTAGKSYTIKVEDSSFVSNMRTRISDTPFFITTIQTTLVSSGMFGIIQTIRFNATRTGTHYIQISTIGIPGFWHPEITISSGIASSSGTPYDVVDIGYLMIMILPVMLAAVVGIVALKKWDRFSNISIRPKFSRKYTRSTFKRRRRSLYARKEGTMVGTDVEIKRQFEYVSGFVRVKVKLSNNSRYVITNVRFQLELSEAFILRRVEPDYEIKQDEVQLGEISSNTEKTIGFTVEPQICGKEKFYGNLEYRDHTGTPKVESMRPIEVEVVCPLFFTEHDANVAKLTNLIRTKLKKSDERCYAIPIGLKPSLAFTILRDTIERHHVKFVSEDIDKEPTFEGHAWYYGKSKVHELDFVIQVIVSESSQSMKIMVDCGDDVALTGYLSEIGRQMRKGILNSGAITTVGDLKALRCPSCAGPLPEFPKPGETVTCGYCNFKVTFF